MTVDIPTLAPSRLSQRRLLLTGGLVLWVTIVLGAYYTVHKPVPEEIAQAGMIWGLLQERWSLAALLDADLNFGIALWVLLASFGTGALLLEGILGNQEAGLLERAAFGTALGLGALAVAVFLLGVSGGLNRTGAYVVMGVFSVAGVVGLRRLPWNHAFAEAEVQEQRNSDGFLIALQALLALIALLTFTKALTPPVAWDSLVYHLTEPQRYIQEGRIIGGIDIPHFYFPALVEQLFTLAMLVKGDIAAQMLHLALAGVGALALYGFLARYHSPRAAWLSLALLASATSLLSLATQAYVEWGLLTFGFLAFWALHEALERGSQRWLVLSGCLAGLTLGVKYTGVFLVVALALVLVWRAAHSTKTEGSPAFPPWSTVALWSAVVVVIASPWYLKNWVVVGNPIYPFLFGGWGWDSWRADWFSRLGTGLIQEPLRLLSAPWELTVLGKEGGAFYDVTLGPLFLGLLPLVLVAPRTAWLLRALVVVILLYCAWLFGAAQSELLIQGRLLLPALPFLAATLAAGLTEAHLLALPFLKVQYYLEAVVLLVLGLSLLQAGAEWVADPPLPYILGAESQFEYQERHLGDHYNAMSILDNQLPQDAKVYFLWEPRSYLCSVACQPDALLYNWRYLLYRFQGPDGVYEALRQEGYTHMLLYGGGLRYFSAPPNVEIETPQILELARFESRYLKRLYGPSLPEILAAPVGALAGKGYTVYQLAPGS